MSQTYEFYTARADEAAADAASATLDNVRERALRSEATWRALAHQASRTKTGSGFFGGPAFGLFALGTHAVSHDLARLVG